MDAKQIVRNGQVINSLNYSAGEACGNLRNVLPLLKLAREGDMASDYLCEITNRRVRSTIEEAITLPSGVSLLSLVDAAAILCADQMTAEEIDDLRNWLQAL